jgi:PIN domain nuclease of toxin-antitoxin system
MRLLLDTPVLVWSLAGEARISPVLHGQLADSENSVFFSAASLWEAAIKHGLGRDDFKVPPAALARGAQDAGFVALPVRAAVAATVAALPHHHRDPAGRFLVAQAMADGLTLYTADASLTRCGPAIARLP